MILPSVVVLTCTFLIVQRRHCTVLLLCLWKALLPVIVMVMWQDVVLMQLITTWLIAANQVFFLSNNWETCWETGLKVTKVKCQGHQDQITSKYMILYISWTNGRIEMGRRNWKDDVKALLVASHPWRHFLAETWGQSSPIFIKFDFFFYQRCIYRRPINHLTTIHIKTWANSELIYHIWSFKGQRSRLQHPFSWTYFEWPMNLGIYIQYLIESLWNCYIAI